jgi:hypothetical protein
LGLLLSFLSLYFLVATQDIAVDGWALTLLRPENVGYASTANTVGQGCGVMAAYGGFMALNSADVCNTYVRGPLGMAAKDVGILSLGDFLRIWGAAFIVVTLLVWALQAEKEPKLAAAATLVPTAVKSMPSAASDSEFADAVGDVEGEDDALIIKAAQQQTPAPARKLRRRTQSHSRSSESASEDADVAAADQAGTLKAQAVTETAASMAIAEDSSTSPSSVLSAVWESYVEFFTVSRLPAILLLAGILVTLKAGFAATDRATSLVMQTRGVPKETLAFIDVASFPIQLAIQVRARVREHRDTIDLDASPSTLPRPNLHRFFSWRR